MPYNMGRMSTLEALRQSAPTYVHPDVQQAHPIQESTVADFMKMQNDVKRMLHQPGVTPRHAEFQTVTIGDMIDSAEQLYINDFTRRLSEGEYPEFGADQMVINFLQDKRARKIVRGRVALCLQQGAFTTHDTKEVGEFDKMTMSDLFRGAAASLQRDIDHVERRSRPHEPSPIWEELTADHILNHGQEEPQGRFNKLITRILHSAERRALNEPQDPSTAVRVLSRGVTVNEA